jgi:TolB-like protein
MGKTGNLAILLMCILSMAGCVTPLVRSAVDGDVAAATALLDQGADVNETYQDITPLMAAANNENENIELVKLLLDRGAKVNAKLPFGNTALFFAVDRSHATVIRMLLAKGADVNIKGRPLKPNSFQFDGEPLSSLELAEKRGDTQIVQMLKSAQSKYAHKFNSANMLLIAVIDFDGKGVSKADATRVSEWLRTELINTGQFKVIERSAMNAILKEQAFAQTGCTDTSCAVQVGRLLSARKMLVGNVESWSGKVFINGRIIDVEKGVAEFAHKETVSSMLDLDTGAANFAKNLSKRINGM